MSAPIRSRGRVNRTTAGVTVEHVQTKGEIADALAQLGIQPRRRYGQNFLIDGNLMRRLVESAELGRGDRVLEVGPGTGGLTDLLSRRVDRVLAVEIDRDLFALLSDRFGDDPGVALILGDALDGKHRVREEIAGFVDGEGGATKLVANLPYQAATPLVLNLLIDHPAVKRLCFTVQAEVGDRITSGPDRGSFGPLAVIAQTLGRVTTVARVPPEAFWPRPSVQSVMLRIDVTGHPFPDRAALHRFVAVVRGAFDHRRKTLRSALSYGLDAATVARACQACDATRRPESFTLAEWMDIHRAVEGV